MGKFPIVGHVIADVVGARVLRAEGDLVGCINRGEKGDSVGDGVGTGVDFAMN
jgi:hypothetical protein